MSPETSTADKSALEMPGANEYDRADPTSCSEGTLCLPFCDENKSILSLNDDSFSHVLTYLSDIDLCRISDVCRRFKALAGEAFRLRYRKMDFYICTMDAETSSILKHFGQHIVSLWSEIEEIEEEDWLLLSKHCNSFTKLRVYCDSLKNLPRTFQSLHFKHVTELTFRPHIENGLLHVLVQKCPNLKTMHLKSHVGEKEKFFDREYTTIEQFSGYSTGVEPWGDHNIQKFLRKNPQLKALRWSGSLQFDADVIRYMENIEHLCLQSRAGYDDSAFNITLNSLRKLKSLELYGDNRYSRQIERKLDLLSPQNKNRIESLGVPGDLMVKSFCEVICKFTNLKSLRIDLQYSSLIYLEQIAGKLKKLECLELKVGKGIDEIYGVVEKAGQLKSFRILDSPIFIEKCVTINEDQFLRLVDARKKSQAAYPLKIHLPILKYMPEACMELINVRQRHLDVIQLNGACPTMDINFFGARQTDAYPYLDRHLCSSYRGIQKLP